MGIRVIPHRGTCQIGGVCTEISTDKTRLLFDFGDALEGEGDQGFLHLYGITEGDANCQGIFLTHYHGDHIGQIPRVMREIPVYMNKTAKDILKVQQEHKKCLGEYVWADNIFGLEPDKPVEINDLKITPILSDHSAYKSLMYLIEGEGKRILLTGDYRLHGKNGQLLRDKLSTIGEIDLMITEGTNLTRTSSNYHDEDWVQEQFRDIMSRYKYVFILASSSNLERIASFLNVAPYGYYPLMDDYQYSLMEIYKRDNYLLPKAKELWRYSDLLNRAVDENRGIAFVVRASDYFIPKVKDFIEKHPDETCLIYSMWTGYEKDYKKYPKVHELVDVCKGHVEYIHVSGHVTREDLEEVIKLIKPRKLLIHHTSDINTEQCRLKIHKDIELINIKDKMELII